MNEHDISSVMQGYVDNREMPGGTLIVRKNDEIVYKNHWGYADIDKEIPVTDSTIYRIASMTKCVVGIAVMKMVESGKMGLDDPVSKYIPSFANMRVADDSRYQTVENLNMRKLLMKAAFFRMDKVKTVPAEREITIRDLLSHASGLEQGFVGLMGMLKRSPKDSLKERVEKYSRFALDFQPGTSTNYSPCASFDILGYILEVASKTPVAEHLKKEVFEPLGMVDATFRLSDEQKTRLARIYKRKKGGLIDVSGTKEDLIEMLKVKSGSDYTAGCGGMYCTAKDYEQIARMLCNVGMHNGKPFLRQETVRLIHTEAQERHLEPEPGYVWGLSVKIRQAPARGNSPATAGTYGWSGAPGTHFFVSPTDMLEAVFMTSRIDLGGAGSYISRRVEELVFGVWAGRECK